MRKKSIAFAACSLPLFVALLSSACASDGGGENEPPEQQELFSLERDCTDSIESIYEAPTALPPFDDAERGAILRCAKDREYTATELDALARASADDPYAGRAFTSGARVYRILYRTTRATRPTRGGYASAILYLPTTPRASSSLPLVVSAHGSVGQAPACAPSKGPESVGYVFKDFAAQVYPMVGLGYPTIAPDFAGYAGYGAPDNPPPTYAAAEDLAYSTLDAARAMRRLVGKSLREEVFLTGHSQGGHAVLSALAYSESYGLDGRLGGVAAYIPNWLSQASWGAFLALADSFPIREAPVVNAVSIWYHYTHGELLDGPGQGLVMFRPEKRAAIKEFVDTTCWSPRYPALEALGTTAREIFTDEFQQAIAQRAAGVFETCGGAPGEPRFDLCTRWMERYAADRPRITGGARAVPLVYLYGEKDSVFPPARTRCTLERLEADGVNLELCVEPERSHAGIVAYRADWVSDWIAHKALGTAAPSPCTKTVFDAKGADGAPVQCETPPPND